jgi:hypothetical protein
MTLATTTPGMRSRVCFLRERGAWTGLSATPTWLDRSLQVGFAVRAQWTVKANAAFRLAETPSNDHSEECVNRAQCR